MASAAKVRKASGVRENWDLRRLAYDVFVFSAKKFGVPKQSICIWEGEENCYGDVDPILLMSRIFLKYQITHRKRWSCRFNAHYHLSRFRRFDDTTTILKDVILRPIAEPLGSAFYELLVTLSVINEFIIFLYSNNCDLYLKELAGFWSEYAIKNFTDELVKSGVVDELSKSPNEMKYDSVDSFYNKFIQKFCVPYYTFGDGSQLEETLERESRLFFEKKTKNDSRDERDACHDAFSNTVWRDTRTLAGTSKRYILRSSDGFTLPEIWLSEVYSKPMAEIWNVNPLKADPPVKNFHSWLQDRNSNREITPGSERATREATQNIPDTRRQEAMRDFRESIREEEKGKTNTDSPFREYEHFGQLNINPPEPKPKNICFPIGTREKSPRDDETLFWNRPSTSRQTEAGYSTGSSSEARQKTISASSSVMEYSPQLGTSEPRTPWRPWKVKHASSKMGTSEKSPRDTESSSWNRPGTSCQKAARYRKRSSLETRLKTSSSIVEEDSPQFSPSMPKPWKLESKNIDYRFPITEQLLREAGVRVTDVSTSPQNRQNTITQVAAMDRIGSGQGERQETRVCRPMPLRINAANFSQNRPSTSCQDVAIDRSGYSQETRLLQTESCTLNPTRIDDAPSSQNRPSTSSQEVPIDRSGSSQGSRPSKMKPYTQKPLHIVNAATSSQNRPSTSSQEMAMDRIVSGQGARIKTKISKPTIVFIENAATSSQNRQSTSSQVPMDRSGSSQESSTSKKKSCTQNPPNIDKGSRPSKMKPYTQKPLHIVNAATSQNRPSTSSQEVLMDRSGSSQGSSTSKKNPAPRNH